MNLVQLIGRISEVNAVVFESKSYSTSILHPDVRNRPKLYLNGEYRTLMRLSR